MPSTLSAVFGAMTFGNPGIEGVRVTDIKDAEAILDVFQAHGQRNRHRATLRRRLIRDRPRLGSMGATRLGHGDEAVSQCRQGDGEYDHVVLFAPTGRSSERFVGSLEALKTTRIDMWYLHGPNQTTP